MARLTVNAVSFAVRDTKSLDDWVLGVHCQITAAYSGISKTAIGRRLYICEK